LGRDVTGLNLERIDRMDRDELEALLERTLNPRVPLQVFYTVLNRVIARTTPPPLEPTTPEHGGDHHPAPAVRDGVPQAHIGT
jgi:hypothetical protein